MRYRGSRRWRSLALKHFRRLFQVAEEVAPQDPDLAKRYVQIARRIVLRTRVRLPPDLRHRFCHRCETYFRPGVNARIRIRSAGRKASVIITCLVCGYRRKVVWWRRKNKDQERSKNRSSVQNR